MSEEVMQMKGVIEHNANKVMASNKKEVAKSSARSDANHARGQGIMQNAVTKLDRLMELMESQASGSSQKNTLITPSLSRKRKAVEHRDSNAFARHVSSHKKVRDARDASKKPWPNTDSGEL